MLTFATGVSFGATSLEDISVAVRQLGYSEAELSKSGTSPYLSDCSAACNHQFVVLNTTPLETSWHISSVKRKMLQRQVQAKVRHSIIDDAN